MRAALTACVAALALVALTASVAAASSAPSLCGLPGLVPAAPHRRCTDAMATPPGPRAELSVGGIVGTVAGTSFGPLLRFIVRSIDGSAAAALRATGSLITKTTEPGLTTSWFGRTYWRVALVSLLLTVPFLCGAAVHALVRSDLSLLARAAFGYLPLAVIGVYLAAPLTTMLLAAVDEMSSFVASASGHSESAFVTTAAASVDTASFINGDPFLALVAGVMTVLATLTLWVELLIRDIAVDVVVLMLPLFFAAMVWPARRVWAIRAIELLVALVLAKFTIVCVLSLGGAAITPTAGPAQMLTGLTLVLLAMLSPWALLRILPIHEVAAAAAGNLSQTARSAGRQLYEDSLRRVPRSESGGSDGQATDHAAEVHPEQRKLNLLPPIGGTSAREPAQALTAASPPGDGGGKVTPLLTDGGDSSGEVTADLSGGGGPSPSPDHRPGDGGPSDGGPSPNDGPSPNLNDGPSDSGSPSGNGRPRGDRGPAESVGPSPDAAGEDPRPLEMPFRSQDRGWQFDIDDVGAPLHEEPRVEDGGGSRDTEGIDPADDRGSEEER